MDSINTSSTVKSLTAKYASWIVIFIGILTSVLIFWLEYRDNKLHWEKAFSEDAGQAAVQLKKNFDINEMALLTFANFFACSDVVTDVEFKNFASPLLEKLKYIRGVGFLEKVRSSDRKKFEESANVRINPDSGLFFKDRSMADNFPGYGSDEVFFPFRHFQLRKKDHTPFIGIDPSSCGRFNSGLHESARRGGPFIDSYPAVFGETSSVLFWYIPVFKNRSVETGESESLECLVGFITGINIVEDMMGLFLNTELDMGVKLMVHLDEESDKNIIYGSKMPDVRYAVKNSVNVCGRKFLLTWQAGSGYKDGIETSSAWLIAQFIVIITLFLVSMINIMRAYTFRIEEEVKSRTQELFMANKMLEKEIGFRRNVEADLIKTSITATNILESMAEAFVSFDYEWNFTYVNPAAEKTLGISRAEVIGKSLWSVFSESLNLKFNEEFRRVMKERVTSSFEEYYSKKELWFSVNAYPTLDGVSVYFTDVTGLKKTREVTFN